MGRTACTEPRCLYKGDLFLYLYMSVERVVFTGYKKESPGNKVSESYEESKQYNKEAFCC